MSDQQQEKVHIVFNNKDERVKDTSYEQYIISQNQSLHEENKQLTKHLLELESLIEEHESDNDRADKRAELLKGLLKNFHEMDKMRKEQFTLSRTLTSITHSSLVTYRQRVRSTIFSYEGFSLLCLILFYYNFKLYDFIAVFIYIFMSMMIVENTSVTILPVKELENEIATLQKSIDATIKGQDYIHEFLDSC